MTRIAVGGPRAPVIPADNQVFLNLKQMNNGKSVHVHVVETILTHVWKLCQMRETSTTKTAIRAIITLFGIFRVCPVSILY